jgi:hypothetical protein
MVESIGVADDFSPLLDAGEIEAHLRLGVMMVMVSGTW